MKWLREHAMEFGMSDEEGKPQETAIEECAKVANWRSEGGAPNSYRVLCHETAAPMVVHQAEVRGSGCYRFTDQYLHDTLGLVRIRDLVHHLP